mmetsp:Transcript_34065/g.94252  ORF Transcript_34065/g.94252 Transcript_34065/m.94252 type:complete len:243 (+) Transcript_34065:192-920(+)
MVKVHRGLAHLRPSLAAATGLVTGCRAVGSQAGGAAAAVEPGFVANGGGGVGLRGHSGGGGGGDERRGNLGSSWAPLDVALSRCRLACCRSLESESALRQRPLARLRPAQDCSLEPAPGPEPLEASCLRSLSCCRLARGRLARDRSLESDPATERLEAGDRRRSSEEEPVMERLEASRVRRKSLEYEAVVEHLEASGDRRGPPSMRTRPASARSPRMHAHGPLGTGSHASHCKHSWVTKVSA